MFQRTVLALCISALLALFAPSCLHADTIILRNGASYNGRYILPPGSTINFTGTQGIQYKFPVKDVQTLVFTGTTDTVNLRDGHTYTGQLAGTTTLQFTDTSGIQYTFPIADVSSLVLSQTAVPTSKLPSSVKEVPSGTEISVRVEETIDSKNSAPGQTYRAEIAEAVLDSAGAVAIPKGSPAELQIVPLTSGGVMHSKESALDISSVMINGRSFSVVTSDDYEKGAGKAGIGANKRTAGFLGGGTALGALMGGIFGGGKGALIGALAGAGAGGATQILTRGKQVLVPAESVLMFRLEQNLVLQPK